MIPIEVSDLRKHYGDIRAVDGVSLTINEGEIFGLLGPNGAGKTTTIEILEGLRKKDGGDVRVLGLDPWEDGYELHGKIGVIPQEFTFFDETTPREAIAYYARLFGVKADPDKILKTVLMEDSADTLFVNLSGGQKRKTGLALSLVNSPDLLFLDEPTTGLDPNARRAIWEVIRELRAGGRTIVLTTHYLDEAQNLSDRVAIMDRGRVVARGTSEEIIRQHGSGERLEIRGREALANYIGGTTGLDVSYDNGVVSVLLERRTDALVALEAAERSGMGWGEIRTRVDSLDDVFVKLVSRTMDERGEVAPQSDGGRS